MSSISLFRAWQRLVATAPIDHPVSSYEREYGTVFWHPKGLSTAAPRSRGESCNINSTNFVAESEADQILRYAEYGASSSSASNL
eukprot:CAMPEP_0196587776 /NCGR_PEP_ID=MMETSP1081-20130531/58565_1 /TAXON_ID=36882 /ORGANISM="Pyramimonas amylifera, Strain CCMP720" /LENGTH=84 /DNA_ID=CAMNT_0041910057 /DNA_START=481 /DNA_END=735 /DNA_ORIENTATION=-